MEGAHTSKGISRWDGIVDNDFVDEFQVEGHLFVGGMVVPLKPERRELRRKSEHERSTRDGTNGDGRSIEARKRFSSLSHHES
jgi:hypothetical protein